MEQESFVIRPIKSSDLDWLLKLSHKLETGFTSLPRNENFLAHRVNVVEQSFAESIPPEQRIFLFVREDLNTNTKIGIAGIQANAGYNTIFYNYELATVKQQCRSLNIEIEHQILNLVSNFQTASELISFAIDPELRGKKMGRWLSFSRFMFMAQHRQFFGNKVIAEMRGFCDQDGQRPFWEAVGRHFFAMDFDTADYLTMSTDKQYISDLMARYPIYVDLLPQAAKDVIGIEHATAAPARHFLEEQGFVYSDHIDIFDAGPLLECNIDQIQTVKNSVPTIVANSIKKIDNGFEAIVCNANPDSRTTVGMVQTSQSGELIISDSMAKILDVVKGDHVRYCRI